MADTAQHEAGRVADEVRHQAADLTESTRELLHEQARMQTNHLGQAIGGMGDRIQALADGRPEDAGNAQELAQSIAGQVRTMSSRIDELGFDGAVDELQRYARRRPGAFLAGAAVLGFAAARLTQSARSSADDRGTQSPPPLSVEQNRPPRHDADRDLLVLPEAGDERMPR